MLAVGSLSQEVPLPNCQSACSYRQDSELVGTTCFWKACVEKARITNKQYPKPRVSLWKVWSFLLSPFPLLLCRGLLGPRGHCDVPFSGEELCGCIASLALLWRGGVWVYCIPPVASLSPFLLLGAISRIPREEPFLRVRCDALVSHRLMKNGIIYVFFIRWIVLC